MNCFKLDFFHLIVKIMLFFYKSLVLFWLLFFSLYLGRPILRFYNRNLSFNTLVIGCWRWKAFGLFLSSHSFYKWGHKGWVTLSDWPPSVTQDVSVCCCGRLGPLVPRPGLPLSSIDRAWKERWIPRGYICGWEGHLRQGRNHMEGRVWRESGQWYTDWCGWAQGPKCCYNEKWV